MRSVFRLQFLLALALVVPAAVAQAKVGVGDSVPAVTLNDWQGQPVRLDALRGNVVIIDFWASWCAPCRAALPELDAISKRAAGAGLVVIGVNVDQSRARADQFLAERLPHTNMTLLSDPNGELLARFGAQGMPALYLVDRSGVVRQALSGYEPERLKEVEQAARDLLDKQ